MSKAMNRDARARSATWNGVNGVLHNVFWAGTPLGIGACFAAASWGQIGWGPGICLAAVFMLSLFLRKAPPSVPEAPPPCPREFAVSSFGVISQDAHDEQAGVCLPWSDVTRVDVVAASAGSRSRDPLFFELIGRNRQLVVPASDAVVGRLVDAMVRQLGELDQAQFLRALGNRGRETRFTVWQRPSLS